MYKKLELIWHNEQLEIVWQGQYELTKLTEMEAHCKLDQYEVVVSGEEVFMNALLQEQLILTVHQLQALQVKLV